MDEQECWTVAGVADFGAQGGDPARAVEIDLSTCVNRYGPPPAALDALHCVEPADLLMHPYDAADRLRDAYSMAVGVDPSELLPSRAASEVIWAMGRTLDRRVVAIPLPAYTDYLRVFPGRGSSRPPDEVTASDSLRRRWRPPGWYSFRIRTTRQGRCSSPTS